MNDNKDWGEFQDNNKQNSDYEYRMFIKNEMKKLKEEERNSRPSRLGRKVKITVRKRDLIYLLAISTAALYLITNYMPKLLIMLEKYYLHYQRNRNDRILPIRTRNRYERLLAGLMVLVDVSSAVLSKRELQLLSIWEYIRRTRKGKE